MIIADKCDVRYTRVRDKSTVGFDIHDRVNYAVKKSKVIVDAEQKLICLDLTIDTTVCNVMEYFEIFIGRMLLCQKAAAKLETTFKLMINNQQVM